MNRSRRTVLKGVGAGLVTAPSIFARAARAAGLEKISVRLDWVTWGGHAPFYLALKKGWYREAGLDVAIEEGNGSVTTIQLINSGNFDVGHANLAAMMQAKIKGLSIHAIAGFVRKNDVGLLVPQDSPMRSPKDLAGKKFLYTAGSLEAPFLDRFLAIGGLTRSQVELVSVDASSKNTLYVKGAAEGEFTSVPYALPYTTARPSRGILFADNGMQFPGFGLLSSDDKLKTRGEAIGRFATIVSAAWEYVVAGHEQEGVQAIMDARSQQKLDPNILLSQIEAFVPYLTSDASKGLPIGVMAAEDWQLAIKTMQEVNLLPAGAKADDFYTNRYLDVVRIRQLSGA